MARMDEKPRRRWFRFSLGSLFVVTAICAGGLALWDWGRLPFNLHSVELGMTEHEVRNITTGTYGVGCGPRHTIYDYQLPDGSFYVVIFRNAVVAEIRHVSGR
jgi:hypothetical protein